MPKFSVQIRKKRKFQGNQYSSSAAGIIDNNKETPEIFDENQNNTCDVAEDAANDSLNSSASYSKLKGHLVISPVNFTEKNADIVKVSPPSSSTIANYHSNFVTGYRIIDMELLSVAFNLLLCPECNNNVVFNENKKQGCSVMFSITCRCGWEHNFWLFRKVDTTGQDFSKCRGFDINKRFLYAMTKLWTRIL